MQELDITATELSTDCLIDLLTRVPALRYLSAGQQDGFNDAVLREFMSKGKIKELIAVDFDRNANISEDMLAMFLKVTGAGLKGLQVSGMPHLTEQFWAASLPLLKQARIVILGMGDGCCQKIQSKVNIDAIIDAIASNCPAIERFEARWDADALRYSDGSSKAVDSIRAKCPRLKSIILQEGKYFEIVKSNFDRADRCSVVRTGTNCGINLAYLLLFYKDLIFA